MITIKIIRKTTKKTVHKIIAPQVNQVGHQKHKVKSRKIIPMMVIRMEMNKSLKRMELSISTQMLIKRRKMEKEVCFLGSLSYFACLEVLSFSQFVEMKR
jgi:hypothetical protein